MRYQILICLFILLLTSCAQNSKPPEKPAAASNQTAPAPAPPEPPTPLSALYNEMDGWLGRVNHNRAKDNRFVYMSWFLPITAPGSDVKMVQGLAPGTPFTILSSGRKIAVKYEEYYSPIGNGSGGMEVLFIMDDSGNPPKEEEVVWVLPPQAAAEAESIKLEELPRKDGDRREWQAGSLSFYYQRKATFQADLFLAGIGTEPIILDNFQTSKEGLEELFDYVEAKDTSALDLYKSNLGFKVPVAVFKLKKTDPTVVIFNFLGMECSNYKPVLFAGQNRKELEQVSICVY